MITFKRMSLEVYKRANGEGMIALHASEPLVGTEGIRYLSFYFTHEEFSGVLVGRLSGCSDCSHNLRRFGELYTFYDMEFSRHVRGVMHVPFVNVSIPRYVAKILDRVVRMALRGCEPDGGRITVELSFATRERWMRQYGQGTGKVNVDVSDEKSAAFFTEMCTHGGETFARCIENLKDIARNTTYRHTDVGTVKLFKDYDGFYFCIITPRGSQGLNGGVINHGRDGKYDWSTHT
jgi:hypothetical protein